MTATDTTTGRDDYPRWITIATRWNDYDMLRHVNNVQYYRYFEIAVLDLVDAAGIDWFTDPVIPFAVESLCRYRRPLRITDHVDAGLRVGRLGNSSVNYELGLFMPGEATASAHGHFVHVFVDRDSERPVPIPDPVRKVYARYQQEQETFR